MLTLTPDRPEANPYESPGSPLGPPQTDLARPIGLVGWAVTRLVEWTVTLGVAAVVFAFCVWGLALLTWGLVTDDWREVVRAASVLGGSGWVAYQAGRGVRRAFRAVTEPSEG